jgi:hypothetical protein
MYFDEMEIRIYDRVKEDIASNQSPFKEAVMRIRSRDPIYFVLYKEVDQRNNGSEKSGPRRGELTIGSRIEKSMCNLHRTQ